MAKSVKSKPRRAPQRLKSFGTLMDGLARGKPAKAAFRYDRADMSVSTPAERIKLDPRKADFRSAAETMAKSEAKGLIDILNANARKARRALYRQRVEANPRIKKIVSEGDSWHLFPVIIDELIDQLNKDKTLAIFSADAAGDTAANMWAERQESNKGFLKSIMMERPQVFLLNGGGNDLLQARKGPDGKMIGNLFFHLKDFQPGMTAKQLLRPSIDAEYETAIGHLGNMIAKAAAFDFVKKVVIHGYDYSFPDDDVWLGKPMAMRGIKGAALQRSVVIELIDRVHTRLHALAQSFAATGKVAYVDVRGAVKTKPEWYDEIHPRSPGFKKVAALIRPHL
jgi:hypothetical protein